MAAQVEVPPEDMERHHAFLGFVAGREMPDVIPMIRIHSSKEKPDDAFVNVHYRNTWFWIGDGDLVSKRAFNRLMLFFTMIDTGPRENLPVVTEVTDFLYHGE